MFPETKIHMAFCFQLAITIKHWQDTNEVRHSPEPMTDRWTLSAMK
jgi:hypothetical protein